MRSKFITEKGMDVARPEVDYGRQQRNLLIRWRRIQKKEEKEKGERRKENGKEERIMGNFNRENEKGKGEERGIERVADKKRMGNGGKVPGKLWKGEWSYG